MKNISLLLAIIFALLAVFIGLNIFTPLMSNWDIELLVKHEKGITISFVISLFSAFSCYFLHMAEYWKEEYKRVIEDTEYY